MTTQKDTIYSADPQDASPLSKSELQQYQEKYNSSVEEVERVFQAVGNNKMELEKYFELNTEKVNSKAHAEEPPEIAINPNPGANANIESVMENMSSEDISRQSRLPNHEVTDGEGG